MKYLALLVILNLLHAEPIILVADIWEPYNGNPSSKQPGYVVELAHTIFNDAGLTLEYRVMPWNLALEAAAKGEVAGVIGAAFDDAPGFIFPEEEINRSEIVFVTLRKNRWNFRGLASLKNVVLGAVQDYSYTPLIDQWIAQADTHQVKFNASTHTVTQNFRRLLDGRIDVLMDDSHVISHYFATTGRAQHFRIAGKTEGGNLFVAFSPVKEQSNELAELFSNGIKQMRQDGRLQTILKKYGLKDWK
jgi:polar amino acid transport system substrate-binding protein